MDLEAEWMITANIALDIFCIALSLIPMIYLFSGKRYKQQLNQYFLGISVSNIFMIIGDLIDRLFQSTARQWEKNLVLAGTVLYCMASTFMLYFFACYATAYIPLKGRAKRIFLLSVSAVCSVQIFLALISPFTSSFFYVTDYGYQRGPLFLISHLVPLCCYLLFTAVVILYHRNLKWREVVFFLLDIFIPLGGEAVQTFTRGIVVVNAAVVFVLLLIFVNIQLEHEIALREQEKKLAEQHIDIMLSQIQPHFLYNSLGAIYHLCETNPALAKTSIRKFSDFLRGNMDSLKAHEPIPFEKELNHVMNFLYLEQQRFGERLRVIVQIETSDFFIPPLTLQPLVENAVQHGILHKKEGGTIMIRTEETDRYAIVAIADDGIGMEQAKGMTDLGGHAHIGISNVRSRLEEMVQGSLEIKSGSWGTVATIRIPW